MSGRDPYAPVIDASRRDILAANRRGAAAATAAHNAKGKRDVYHRVRDIRAEVAAEDEKRGRCTW